MNKRITLSVSFAEEDHEFAEKVVLGLLDKGINIKSNSAILGNKVPNWGKHLLDIVDEQFSEDVDFCIVLVTRKYMRSKWNTVSKCSMLEQAYKRKNFILPVKVGSNIPALVGLSLIDYLEVAEDDFQFIIDSFVEKARISHTGMNILQGYKDIEDILRLKEPNADWTKISSDEDIDKERNIGFDLFANTDLLLERVQSYVLFLYHNITIKNTADYIISKHPYIFRDKNLVILIPYQKGQVDYEKRKNNVSVAFRDAKVVYIKDFIWQYCTPKEFRQVKNYIPISNFVIPNIKIEDKTSENREQVVRADQYIINWQNEEDNPLLVIKGDGGTGKTTLANWITNYVENNIPNTRAIFINSSEITAYLKRSFESNNEFNLYKFYEADFEENQSRNESKGKKLEFTEFKCNLDNGNIVLIIDGFEEVITHLSTYFNIDSFLESIYVLSSNIGRGKVVVTTRTPFWDKHAALKDFKYETIEVCPFDYELTYEYFSTYFNKNIRFIEKSFKIARALMLNEQDNYIPFVLDLVTYIVVNRYDNSSIQDSKFDAEKPELLSLDINNDYILFKICSREIIKLDNALNINDQINFFIRLATIYNGKIKDSQLASELTTISGNKASVKNREVIRAHPILAYLPDTMELTFKYDLFDEHFKNIYLGSFLNGKEDLNPQLINILADHNNYKSDFLDTLLVRLGTLDDEKKYILLNIFEQLKNFKINERNITVEIKYKSISALFLFVLKWFHKNSAPNIDGNTALLKEFFSSQYHIDQFALIDCTSVTSPKINFDFSDLVFENAIFSNYEFFRDCKCNDKTFFYDSKFENLQLDINKTYSFKPHSFVRPDGDINFKEYFKNSSRDKQNTKKEIIEDVENFLRIFYKGGKILNVNLTDVRRKYHPKIVPTENMIDTLAGNKILFEYLSPKKKEDKLDIHEDYRYQVIKFLTNGTNSPTIENTLQDLIAAYK